MSCRETSGNSATTSLVKFLTGAPEKLVSHEFHRLRREGKSGDLEATGEQPASGTEVSAFLEKLRVAAANDSRIKESRRASLTSRIDQALDDVANGRGPNQATFYAWQNLESAVTSNVDFVDNAEDDSLVGVTPEGLEISQGDVEAARRMAAQDQEKLGYRVAYGYPTAENKYLRKSAQISTMELWAKAERLEAAFDATDTGYEILMSDERSNPEHAGHTEWKLRRERADKIREQSSAIVIARNQAKESTLLSLEDRRVEAFRKVRHYEKLLSDGKQNSANRLKLQESRKEAQLAQRTYLYKVAEDASVISIAQSKNLTSPSEWDALPAVQNVNRFDVWRSAELIAADLDRARVRVGRIPQEEAARRELIRAQARQAILDSEGQGTIDPVNKKFAATLQQRRAINAREAV